jgi:hypothetical protein
VSFGPKQSDIAPGFFRRLPAWALTFIDEEGFECIGKERTEAGPTTTCYQSPLDASIEAVYLGKFYRPHRVNVACEFDIGAFLDERGHSLVAAMHIGWPAHDGRLLLHPDGRLGRTCRLMRQSLGVPPTFEIDGPTLDAYHCWRERAGLFAWAETVRDVRAWPLTWLSPRCHEGGRNDTDTTRERSLEERNPACDIRPGVRAVAFRAVSVK